MSSAEFRKIESLNNLYEINSDGTIFRNAKTKKESKIKLDMHHSDKGYYAVWIHLGGRNNPQIKHLMIHKLVAECWLGKCPKGYEIDHKDRNSHNNDYHNLRYVTKSEQMKNRDYSKISVQGSKNLEEARNKRKKSITLSRDGELCDFESIADCARYLSNKFNDSFERARYKLRRKQPKMYNYYDVQYH